MNEFFYGEISPYSLTVEKGELLKRLSVKGDYNVSSLNDLISEVLKEVKCCYTAVKTTVKYGKNDDIIFDFGTFSSKSLKSVLNGNTSIYIFAVTLGNSVDRLINKYQKISLSKQFFIDAIASSLIESARKEVQKILTNNDLDSRCFSPGYGDLSLQIQPYILTLLNASKLINVTINKSLLMSPSKTITAIVGVYD